MRRHAATLRARLQRAWKIALWLLVTWCPAASALDAALDVSQYGHSAWKIREGFVKTRINSIAQTPDGYLWLATTTGLFRFDGVQNVALQLPAGVRLPSDDVRRLLVAHDGRLWIGTLQGLASWKDGKLTLYPQLDGQGVYSLVEDRQGAIWASGQRSDGAANLLCAIEASHVRCFGQDGSLGTGLYEFYEDRRGRLWAAGNRAVWRLNPGPSKFYQAPLQPCGFLEAEDGTLLLFSWDGVWRIDDDKGAMQPTVGTANRCTATLLPDRDGGVWIGSLQQGLWHAHQGVTDRFTHADGLSGDWVSAVFEDREGNVWVGTQDGLDRFSDVAVATLSQKQGLSGSSVSSVLAATDGSVWVGTYDGLNQWKDGQLTIYRKRAAPPTGTNGKRELNGLDAFRLLGGPRLPREVFDSGLPDEYIESLFQDDEGQVWASTHSGLARFKNGRFISLGVLASGWIHSFVTDRSGGFWFGDDLRLVHMLNGAVIESVPVRTLGINSPAWTLSSDASQGGLWLGMLRGGVAYYKDGRVRASYSAADGLGQGAVSGLRLDAGGALWAATQGGLSRLKDGRVATLSSKNGLPCDAVLWSMQTDDHSYWLYMACGLVRIEGTELDAWGIDPTRSVRVALLDGTAGVRSNPYPSGGNPSVARAADGKLWFPTAGGVSIFDPRRLSFNKLPPPVHVEQVVADRKTYEASSRVNLPPLVRDLHIDYTALSFVAPEKVLFRYKLEGRDRDWQDAGNRRQAFYTDLDPGNYRFRVIACNNSGVWNEEGASLDFSIAPAYWQTNWFRALCVALLAALLYAIYRLRLRQVARHFNATLDARVSERTRIARDLHDTLLQSFHGLLLRFQTAVDLLPNRAAEAKQVLVSTIDQAAEAITEGRDAVQGLRASTTETNDLADAIRTLGEELAAEEGEAAAEILRVDVQGSPRTLHPILRDEIFRIAGEAVRNAFRHAGAKQIEVELRYDERYLRLRVRDDGKGIDPKILSQGGREGHFGMHGMRERAKLIGGKLTVWSALDSGTEVELTIPAPRAYAASPSSWRSRLAEKLLRQRATSNASDSGT